MLITSWRWQSAPVFVFSRSHVWSVLLFCEIPNARTCRSEILQYKRQACGPGAWLNHQVCALVRLQYQKRDKSVVMSVVSCVILNEFKCENPWVCPTHSPVFQCPRSVGKEEKGRKEKLPHTSNKESFFFLTDEEGAYFHSKWAWSY